MLSTVLVALVLGVWIIVLISGMLLIRDARPYSASRVGKLVAALGALLIIWALVMLVKLSGTITSSSSASTESHISEEPPTIEQVM